MSRAPARSRRWVGRVLALLEQSTKVQRFAGHRSRYAGGTAVHATRHAEACGRRMTKPTHDVRTTAATSTWTMTSPSCG